jgi:hypothetical protein
MTCQRKILILRGTLVFHTFINHLLEKPVKVSSLYKDDVEKAPDFSNTHWTESLVSLRITEFINSLNSENSAASLTPKFLLKVSLPNSGCTLYAPTSPVGYKFRKDVGRLFSKGIHTTRYHARI